MAFFCALAAPLMRAIEPGRHLTFLGLFVMQLAITGATVGFYSVRRVQVIRSIGKRIGIGYPGTIPGKHWPKIVSGVTLLAFALFQLTLAVVMTVAIPNEAAPIALAPVYGQLAFFTGSTLTQLFWGRSLGATEFFEKGIVRGAFQMIHWEDITVRKSQFMEDRIVIMIKPYSIVSPGMPHLNGNWTTSLQVPDDLRDYLLERYPEGPRPQLNQISTAIGYSPGSEREGNQTNS
ncbi:hypothetical protein [Blastopirellula marina]|uniref:hypothetical protein n=1 Tax=Blastopirellula marina TaxID=124 RepID=UPI000CFA0B72|nr:hypothetical protein [Blastopirellula marina]